MRHTAKSSASAATGLPPLRFFSREGLHRLIPSLFNDQGSVLSEIADDEVMLADLILLDGATNDRIRGEHSGLPGISPYELVYGIPNAHIVNAAFTHAGPEGSRFSDAARGAWYCADTLDTSVAEVAFHKARRLGEIIVPGLPGERPDRDSSMYDDWLADLRTELHVLEPASKFSEYLRPEPVPACYAPSQRLARELLLGRSNGVLYPSVRRPGSECVACFRPALVYGVRRGVRVELVLTASESGYTTETRHITC